MVIVLAVLVSEGPLGDEADGEEPPWPGAVTVTVKLTVEMTVFVPHEVAVEGLPVDAVGTPHSSRLWP